MPSTCLRRSLNVDSIIALSRMGLTYDWPRVANPEQDRCAIPGRRWDSPHLACEIHA